MKTLSKSKIENAIKNIGKSSSMATIGSLGEYDRIMLIDFLKSVRRDIINDNEEFENKMKDNLEEAERIKAEGIETLRDRFAMAALNYLGDVEDVSKSAYRIADAMIKEREKK